MPSFGESALSDKQAKDIYAYIRTFKSSAPELKDIPTLNAIVDANRRQEPGAPGIGSPISRIASKWSHQRFAEIRASRSITIG